MREPLVTNEAAETPRPPEPAAAGAVSGVLCSCGHTSPVGSSQCARPSCRRVLQGNQLSHRHGLYASKPAEAEAIEQAGVTLVEQSITDAGGRDELSARELADHGYRGLLHTRILMLAHSLQVHGDYDKRGRLKKGQIELLERLITSAVSLDRTLGLGRKARPLPTARELMTAIASEKAREAAE